ncbi:hypothetical protein ASPZODRAFT_129525 [Penicilliopsis zonata CBS 506.65]|uniref:Autophagy-related protein 2 n=1 Tax=Penicilliopsis zonata CBS 506.65 TaxID=1073090 RepID=A0A1L9SPI6_9EURO|nr:hypothetical protein ASPZODRAFT_129525 [Penicilliopsis zonata CBS 506.65]OJJ49120.1 hypothetical protein ASPZODRAFT_129525 [Penicilliopsis zonata CBS 506.65]
MAYFLPSFFQKRLLRYALSRLELVDTEALDLDSLGIRWGQRSTVELRDVGLKLEKLASLLRLPKSCELLNARVQYLQITVPADIYSSGIICEARGIDVHLRLVSEEKDDRQNAPPPQQHPAVHDPGGDQILPNPTDLAASFLETELTKEKEELQAAISSRSQLLQRPYVSSSDDDEDELGLGNETVSLPSFVAGFLKGVADRLQAKVTGIAVRVDMEVKKEGDCRRLSEDQLDLLTAVFSVQELHIHPVSSAPAGAAEEDGNAPGREGRRLISLSNIHATLVSDPIVFSNYSRFAVPASSPSTTMHSKEEDRVSSRASSPLPMPSPSESTMLAMTHSTILDPPPSTHDYMTNSVARETEMEASTFTSDGQFSDADTDAEYRSDGSLDGSHNFLEDEAILDNPEYLDSVLNLQIDEDEEPEASTSLPPELLPLPPSAGDTPRLLSPQLQDSGSLSQDRPVHISGILGSSGLHAYPRRSLLHGDFGHDAEGYGEMSSQESQTLPPGSSRGQEDLGSSHGYPSSVAGSSSSKSESSVDELSESKLFSHEEAQSMYMSAVSEASVSGSFMPNIPGAWDSPTSMRLVDSYADPESAPLQLDIPAEEEDGEGGEGEQEDTVISTPKLTAQPTLHPDLPALSDSQLKGLSEPPAQSNPPSPVINRTRSMAKRLLEIDKIQIWLPSTDQRPPRTCQEDLTSPYRKRTNSDLKESVGNLGDSVATDSMLSTRLYASTRFRSDSAESNFSSEHPSFKSRQPDETSRPLDANDEFDDIIVEVSSVSIQFDIATGWLVVKVGQRIIAAFDNSGEEESLASKQSPEEKQNPFSLRFSLGSLAVKFLEHMPGHYCSPEDSRLHLSQSYFPSLEDVILQLSASGLKTHLLATGASMKLNLNVSKFVFGFASEDLLSFNEGLKMRESTRDILAPTHGDISLSISKSAESARVHLTTLPVHLNLNIQRLEEVINCIGGLSTILELGSSISSVSTVRGAKPEPAARPRGVRFETSPPAADAPTTALTPWKVNARIGGIVLDVVGETHYIKFKTTAIKVVSRFEGIGVQIDKAKLTGPVPLDESRDAPGKVTLENIRLEYLFVPKETDLDRLLSLITPSKDKYDEDDDIMLDTLFRQRRQGAVLRTTVSGMKLVVTRTGDLDALLQLGNELNKLSTVTKYLPEDDRPGILLLTLIKDLVIKVHLGGQVGEINTHMTNAEAAHITMPSLTAARIDSMAVVRNGSEELLGEALPFTAEQDVSKAALPMLMARFIPDEMDPTFKIKLYNLRVEYTIPSVIAFLGLGDNTTTGDLAANMANSLVNLADLHVPDQGVKTNSRDELISASVENSKSPTTPTRLSLVMRDCILGLNPRSIPAKALLVLTSAKFSGAIHDPDSSEATLDLKKASIMIIDDVENVGRIEPSHRRSSSISQSSQVQSLIDLGYVTVTYLSSAMAVVKLMSVDEDGTKSIDVELRDDLLVLETCADSTQTLISILNGLQPPTPPSAVLKYRTEVMPLQDMLASFSGDAYATDPFSGSDMSGTAEGNAGRNAHPTPADPEDELEYVSDFYPPRPESDGGDPLASSMSASIIAAPDSQDLLDSFHSHYHVSSSIGDLEFRDDHFAKQSAVGGTAHRWDSAHNTYGLSNEAKLQKSPLRVRLRDVHVIWNLFDGYDWQRTRDTISRAVKDVELKATERRARAGRMSPGVEDEEESVIGDFLFNSIYIGIPANKDPRELNQDINRNIDDLISETGSYATSTTVTGATARPSRGPSLKGRKLRLSRSKQHKMTFELKGVCADLVIFPPGADETQSSLDVRIKDLEIFDHVPTSTWKKFATYMHEVGEKEAGTSMVHLEVLTVKPVPELAASEIILKATVLPVRLHVDQDALDFMSRFFEFRDESAPTPSAPGDVPFLQRVEINAVRVKLDFKPKRVDYAGLRSGRTTEFMNFFVLDGADMVLRHVIIYGVSGFDKLGQTLNDIWMPDVKSNQLPGVLAGLAPIRSLVNVGGGVKDLVVIPMREYQKDGRIVRSIQKGAMAFAKTTTSELVKLGAKLAIGTQTVLQSAEDLFNAPGSAAPDDDLTDEEETKRISLYADQPVGVVQGLRGAFSSLERDLLMARDAIVAVPGEVVESGSAKAAAKAVWKRTPTVILRPAIGVSKAVGQTLLGAGNTLDPSNRRKMEDKYKRH